MLIGFLGSPCSGKTTTAAKIFAELKDSGIGCEFISEQARVYIAEKRNREDALSSHFLLNDEDQLNIMKRQAAIEKTMEQSVGRNGVVIADSSPLNSLLYMSKEYREKILVTYGQYLKEIVNRYAFCFISFPLGVESHGADPNRVHGFEESKIIHGTLEKLLGDPVTEGLKTHVLVGTAKYRFQEGINEVAKMLLL